MQVSYLTPFTPQKSVVPIVPAIFRDTLWWTKELKQNIFKSVIAPKVQVSGRIDRSGDIVELPPNPLFVALGYFGPCRACPPPVQNGQKCRISAAWGAPTPAGLDLVYRLADPNPPAWRDLEAPARRKPLNNIVIRSPTSEEFTVRIPPCCRLVENKVGDSYEIH